MNGMTSQAPVPIPSRLGEICFGDERESAVYAFSLIGLDHTLNRDEIFQKRNGVKKIQGTPL